MTDPIVPCTKLIDESLQGWTPDQKLLVQLLVYTGDDRESDRILAASR